MKLIILWLSLGLPASQLIVGEEGIYVPILKDTGEYCMQVQYGLEEGFSVPEKNLEKCFYQIKY